MSRAKGKGARREKTRRKKPSFGRKPAKDLEPTQGGALRLKGGAVSGRVTTSDLSITKVIDKSSPSL